MVSILVYGLGTQRPAILGTTVVNQGINVSIINPMKSKERKMNICLKVFSIGTFPIVVPMINPTPTGGKNKPMPDAVTTVIP